MACTSTRPSPGLPLDLARVSDSLADVSRAELHAAKANVTKTRFLAAVAAR